MKKETVNRGQKRTDALAGKIVFNQGKGQIIVYDETGTPRIIIGLQEGGF